MITLALEAPDSYPVPAQMLGLIQRRINLVKDVGRRLWPFKNPKPHRNRHHTVGLVPGVCNCQRTDSIPQCLKKKCVRPERRVYDTP